ncbi:heme ABC exporter ATP-binding protein CcmA [Fretibacter rubidus]|uniref:heme ABC exporter ATP-binding protein CcmA n=1 Tax=Fretibacter rubidus TaxID=570162 RepID=UPI00352B6D50
MSKTDVDIGKSPSFTVSVRDLSLSRGTALLFSGVSFSIDPGQLIWVNGGNGMGKTSLLRLLAGFSRADSGIIDWSKDGRSVAAKDLVGFQGHHDAFKSALTAHESLVFWADLMDVPDDTDSVLKAVGLAMRADVRTGALSAGQKRRLALARLMLSKKPLWVMDEPTAAMDTKGVALIHSLVEGHIRSGGSAIIASHNPAQNMSAHTRRLTLNTLDDAPAGAPA